MRIFTIIVFLFLLTKLQAQDFADEFNKFKTQDEKEFERTVQQQDSIFARFIIENWKQLELKITPEKESVPKPQEQPILEESFELEDVKHQNIELPAPRLMRSFSPPSMEYNEEHSLDKSLQFNFYGEAVQVRFSNALLKASEISVSDKYGIAKAWDRLSKSPYKSVLTDLYSIKEELQLPDYGYLLLVESFVKELNISSSAQEIYKWFFLVKTGYEARVGLLGESPTLIIGSYGKIYGKRYYGSDGVSYYVLSGRSGKLESYQSEEEKDSNLFDFTISEEIRLPLKALKRNLSYTSKNGKPIKLEVYYNVNISDMLNNFPQVDLAYYLSSTSSDLLKKSLEKSLSPYLEGLSKVDQLKFLLEFSQKAFQYKSDSKQFGKERAMYPEELFAFPFSDCEDRVALLSYLIRNFADTPIIAIGFPQHVALGIRLPAPSFGESVIHKGYTFTFCDPTYYNAPIGTVISSADRDKMKVIEF